jgi:hypothetical protein
LWKLNAHEVLNKVPSADLVLTSRISLFRELDDILLAGDAFAI